MVGKRVELLLFKEDDDKEEEEEDEDEEDNNDRLRLESICRSILLVPRPESFRSVDERFSSVDDVDVGERSSIITGSLRYPSGAGTLS